MAMGRRSQISLSGGVTIKMEITITNPGALFKARMEKLAEKFARTVDTAMRMAQSMLLALGRADIASAGDFGPRWTDALQVTVDGSLSNMRLSMTLDVPGAGIFETGGTITGAPLLWIPLSGTDAAGIKASAFSDGLVSSRYQARGGRPLLFSVTDRQPRYFGIESVTIPKKFHLSEDLNSVMSNFRSIFADVWAQS